MTDRYNTSNFKWLVALVCIFAVYLIHKSFEMDVEKNSLKPRLQLSISTTRSAVIVTNVASPEAEGKVVNAYLNGDHAQSFVIPKEGGVVILPLNDFIDGDRRFNSWTHAAKEIAIGSEEFAYMHYRW